MTGISCDKCKGTGLVAREGREADKSWHPNLSQTPGTCDKCGGGGLFSPDDAHRLAKAAAKAAEG